MRFQFILFDLDGTLTDPGIGITNSIMFALKKYSIDVGNRSELYKFIGPPLLESFEKFYGFSENEAKKAVEYYREYFSTTGIYENSIYPGVEDLLKDLIDNGATLILATSKPQVFAKRILEHFNISKYFTFIAGSELDGARAKKDEVIRYALESCSVADLAKAIMVGDREHDIIGAKAAGISSIGVLFGYGDSGELERASADYIVDTVSDIRSILIP